MDKLTVDRRRPPDIATGTGLAARACALITHAPPQIVGIDVSHGMLQAAAAVSRSSYLQADAAQLPFRPATFDALLCVAAIPYLPDLAKAVAEWRRVAQPGADLVFTTPPPTASPHDDSFGRRTPIMASPHPIPRQPRAPPTKSLERRARCPGSLGCRR